MDRSVAEYDEFPQSINATSEPNTWLCYRIRYASGIGGKSLSFPVAEIFGSAPGPRVTIVAGVHGDEFEGVKALWDLINDPHFVVESGSLVIVPIANIPAYEAGTRVSPIDSLNLARVFPGNPSGTITERLADTLFSQVVQSSDFLLDLHSGGVRYLHLPLAGFYEVEGGVGQKSLSAAKALGWKYLWAAPRRDGVLSFEAVKHGIPAIGTEVGGAGRCLPQDVAFYPDAFDNLFKHLGIKSEPPKSDKPVKQTIIKGDWLIAEESGFIDNKVGLGDEVARGMLLAQIVNPFGEKLQEINAPTDGIVVGIRSFPTIQAGEWSIFVGKADIVKKE